LQICHIGTSRELTREVNHEALHHCTVGQGILHLALGTGLWLIPYEGQ